MSIRYFALALGIVYTLVGLLGFLPGITQPPPPNAPTLAVDAGYGFLLGLFPINVLHNIVHLLIGVLGIAASRRVAASRQYARGLAVVYGVLAVMGLIPGLDRTFGFIPLFGHDVWLHALTALASAYFGFMAPATVAQPERRLA